MTTRDTYYSDIRIFIVRKTLIAYSIIIDRWRHPWNGKSRVSWRGLPFGNGSDVNYSLVCFFDLLLCLFRVISLLVSRCEWVLLFVSSQFLFPAHCQLSFEVREVASFPWVEEERTLFRNVGIGREVGICTGAQKIWERGAGTQSSWQRSEWPICFVMSRPPMNWICHLTQERTLRFSHQKLPGKSIFNGVGRDRIGVGNTRLSRADWSE